MKKLALFLAGILLCSSLFASEKEDLNFLEELYKQGRYKTAINESERFINNYPKSKYIKNIQIRIAKTYYFEKNYTNSIKYLNMALANKLSDSEKEDIQVYLVKSYAGLDDYQRAYGILNEMDKKSSYYEKALLDLGIQYIEKGKYLDAQRELAKVLSVKGKYYDEAVINLALATYNNSQYVKTIVYLDEYYNGSQRDKNYPLMNYLYGSSYYKMDDKNKAIQYFTKVIDSYPDSSYGKKSMLTMVELYLNQRNIQLAEKMLNGLTGSPEQGEAIKIFADYYALRGNYSTAVKYYEAILKLNRPDITYGYAFSIYKLGREQEAIEKFKSLRGTKYYDQSIYYIFAGEYKLKNYSWIVQNKDLINNLSLNKADLEGINSIVANSAYELKNYGLAEKYYENIYISNPNKENLYRVIVVQSKLGNTEKLYSRFNEYMSKYPTDQEYRKNIYLVVGEIYYKQGRFEDAKKLYTEYLSINKDTTVTSNLIAVLLEQKNYNEVLSLLNSQDISDENTYLKGIAAMGMGNYEEANNYFASVLNSQSSSADLKEKTTYNQVKNYFLWENYPETIALGESYLSGDHLYKLDEIVDRVALSYFRQDQMDKAREYFEKLKLVPEYSDYAQFQIAETYYSEKNYTKAAQEYRRVSETATSPEYKEKALYWEANSFYTLGKNQEFKKIVDIFLATYPTSNFKDNLLLLNGQILDSNGNSKQSLKNYEELYGSSKDNKIKEEAAAKIVELHGRDKNAAEGFKWIEKLGDESKKSYYKSEFYEQKGDMENAVKEYEKLLESREYKDFAALKLGNYWYKQGKYDKARQYYTIISGMDSSQYKDIALFQLASVDEQEKKYEEAVRNYTKIYVLYPNGKYAIEAQIKAAENYEKMKNYKNAIEQYKEVLGRNNNERYKAFLLEKLTFLYLKVEDKTEAKKYYNQLKGVDAKIAEKYKDFFTGGNQG